MPYLARLDYYNKIAKFVVFNLRKKPESKFNATQSLNAFIGRESKAFNTCIDLESLNNITYRTSIETLKPNVIIKDIPISFAGVPIVSVNSVWEMYKEIGYDFRTKKYIGLNEFPIKSIE